MQTGWVTLNGSYYYLDPSTGKMAANTTLNINGVSYTFNANGVYQNGGSAPSGNTYPSAPGSNTGGPGSGSSSPGGTSSGNTLKEGLTTGPGAY